MQADAGKAKSKFEEVAGLDPEIAAIAARNRLVVTLYSELSEDGIEICQVIDGHVDWSIHR